MGRLGFGHGGKGSTRLLPALAGRAAEIVELAPSLNWVGTAGSGFAVLPTDPPRGTAKPIVRLLDPPNQFFTDSLTVSVMAFANDGGQLIGGIDRVRFRFEGNTVDVLAPAMRTFTRYDGTEYTLPCYTVRLTKPGGISGLANLYIEVIPSDATMQSRVLGPYQFSPVATKHDWDRTIGSSGADYTTIAAAIAAAKTAAAQNPRVTFITSGTYDMAGGTPNYVPQGYMTFECADAVEVTFAKASYTTDTAMLFRTRWDGLWFKGAGFTFDMAYADRIWNEAQSVSGQKFVGRSHVFEGVRFTRSTAPGSLIRKMAAGGTAPFSVTGSPWVMDCHLSNMQQIGEVGHLLRGNIYSSGFQDVAYGVAAMVGNRVESWSSKLYRTPIAAFTAQYTGSGASATLSLSGLNNAGTRTWTAKVDGSSVGTFTTLNNEAASIAGTNYNVANVVDWINSLTGWTATLQDDTRAANTLTSGSSGFGAFTDLDAKAAPLQFFTAFDMHTDFYQKDSVNLVENVLIYGNTGIQIDAQLIMIGGNESRDWMILNNALSIDADSDDNMGGTELSSQFSQPHKHVVFAHNSFPHQRVALRTGSSSVRGYNPDTYSMVANNSIGQLIWDIGGVDADLLVKNNHLHAGATGTGDTGETKGGDWTTLYLDWKAGNFTPSGELAANLKTSVWNWDAIDRKRGSTSSPGAIV